MNPEPQTPNPKPQTPNPAQVYAPWCGHCKSLEPVYQSVGVAFAGEPRVVVAKIDGTKNDFNLMPVNGFPTLFVFPAHAKTAPVPVSGRDAHTLIQAVSN